MTQEDLNKIVKEHRNWIHGEGGSRAVLRDAVLRDADLRGADLRDAALRGADLRGAVLCGADLCGAVLCGAVLCDAALCDATVPKVEKLHSKIAEAIERGGKLEMGAWHSCETTHCRGGWAVVLAGENGRALENAVGIGTAAALIYATAYPDQRVPDFYTDNETAMEDIKRCAAEEMAVNGSP